MVAGVAATVLSGGNFMVGFQTYSMVSSAFNAAQTGNWGGLAISVGASLCGAAVGNWSSIGVAKMLGAESYTFGGGFLIGATEFGSAAFISGAAGAAGNGANFGQAMRAGLISGGIGAVTGGLLEGSYLGGWQSSFHGQSVGNLMHNGVLSPIAGNMGFNSDLPYGTQVAGAQRKTSYGWYRYLHGTDTAGSTGFVVGGKANVGTYVTFHNAMDPETGKLAEALSPRQYERFTSIAYGRGNVFVDIAAPSGSARMEPNPTAGGAPQLRIWGDSFIERIYPNLN